MDSPTYIFCKWKRRFWPAKVLTKSKQPLSKNSKLQVEIFEENKQTSVHCNNTKPFLMGELRKISDTLDRTKNLNVTAEELIYRGALERAMNLLKDVSATETELLQDDKNAATFETSGEAGKLEETNECISLRTNLTQKEAPGTAIVDEGGATLKRKKSLRTTQQSMHLKASNMPKAEKTTKIKDTRNRKKRKRGEDTTTTQGSFPSENKSKTGEPKSVRMGRSNGPPSSPKEIQNVMSPSPDEDDARNGNLHPKLPIPQSSNMDNVQVATTILKVRSDTEEDSHRKSKYNRLPLPDFSFESDVLSSELSMEMSSPETSAIREVWPNDDTEEDIQLPVIDLNKEPVSFERGAFVWCKFQRYPYWPSLVKFVRNKEKRATIIFVEECLSDPNSQPQSFQVSFRTLKHYDCAEKQELLDIARKDYGKSVDWCDALISDYRIRLGCGSFSDSFLEYCKSAISYPVRKECCTTKLNFPSLCPDVSDSVQDVTHTDCSVQKKILPDRMRASRDRANEKLVECIVKNRQADCHLISILTGKKKSHWLEKFQSSSNQEVECVETYIEDLEQAGLVADYLRLLYNRQSKKLPNVDETKFIFEVMFPEAVIFAISVREGLSYKKAEKKYLEGPLLTKRERKQFEKQILDNKRIQPQQNLQS